MALIYLAGKIERNCWRHSIVKGLSQHSVSALILEQKNGEWEEMTSLRDWGILRQSIFEEHDYAGPFFASCKHGTWHGQNKHGNAVGDSERLHEDDEWDIKRCCFADFEIVRAAWVHEQCLSAIRRCDIVFAWITSTDCFGTIYELGLAKAMGKKIFIASPCTLFSHYKYEDNGIEWWTACKRHEVPEGLGYSNFLSHDVVPSDICDLWLCFQSAHQTMFEAPSAEYALKEFLYPQENQDPLANGYVYFIEALGIGHIKIGWSVNPTKRLAQLQTGSSARLQLLGFIPGKRAFEQKLHADFAHLRHHDEWFHGTEELRSYIKSQCEELK